MSLEWGKIIIELLGGLAIFLYGMVEMIEGLKAVAGNRLKSFLTRMTYNRWSSMLAGAGITAVIQSSSVTTVIVVGFVSAGLLSFPRTLGIILGADIGTTITAQIIAFKITEASFLFIAIGYLVMLSFRNRIYRNMGTILLGLGMVFLGMNIMGSGANPLKEFQPFLDMMQSLENPFWGILVGALFTAVIQSSSATTGIIIVMAMQDLIGLNAGISIIIGANIGTCVTALLAAIGKPLPAMQVAVSHILFKVVGAMLWFMFIPVLGVFVASITPNDLSRQIANAHTVFNVVNAFLFIGFTIPVAKLVERMVPDKQTGENGEIPLLDKYYLEDTGLALDIVDKVIDSLGKKVLKVADEGFPVAIKGDAVDLTNLRMHDRQIDDGQRKVLSFLHQIQQKELQHEETLLIRDKIETANILELLGDLITTDLVEAAEHRIKGVFAVSKDTSQILENLYKESVEAFRLAFEAYVTSNEELLLNVLKGKADYKEKLYQAREHLTDRLSINDVDRIAIIRFETEVLEVTRRMHALARRLARLTKNKMS